jgi:hypothetical protein
MPRRFRASSRKIARKAADSMNYNIRIKTGLRTSLSLLGYRQGKPIIGYFQTFLVNLH